MVRHDVADLGGNVGNKTRGRDTERLEHEVDAGVGVATAGGLGMRRAGPALEFGVANGGANRIRVRVAMADDQQFRVAHVGLTIPHHVSAANRFP